MSEHEPNNLQPIDPDDPRIEAVLKIYEEITADLMLAISTLGFIGGTRAFASYLEGKNKHYREIGMEFQADILSEGIAEMRTLADEIEQMDKEGEILPPPIDPTPDIN